MVINMGADCIDRKFLTGGYTLINLDNPANKLGTISKVCFYSPSGTYNNVYFGIFYIVSGNTWRCRSASGPFNFDYVFTGVRTANVNLAVEAGDCIGVWLGEMYLDRGNEGNDLHSDDGNVNHCIVGDETEYGTGSGPLSLRGYSEGGVTVTFVTKKEDGSELTGVKVYIDAIEKGET